MSVERVFEALASTARRKILAYLSHGELSAGDIADRFEFSKPALSGHLRILEEAGLVTRDKRGQFVYYTLAPDRLTTTVFAWAAEVCPVAGPLKRESKARARKRATSGKS